MNCSENGWICLHRKIIDSMVFQNEGLLKLWIWCLAKANHETAWVPFVTGRSVSSVKVKPGQFIFGRKSAAKELMMDESTIYKRMKLLEKHKNLTIESNTHYSIISIINWDTYQNIKLNGNIESNRQVTGKEQASNTNNNDNNDNKEEIYDQNSLIDSVSSEDSQPTPPSNKLNRECSAKKKQAMSEQLSTSFGLFWQEYPRKVSKKTAESAWIKINPQNGTVEKILSALKEYKKTEQWQKNNGQFIPHPSSWLNQERWKDEITCNVSSENTDWSYWENL